MQSLRVVLLAFASSSAFPAVAGLLDSYAGLYSRQSIDCTAFHAKDGRCDSEIRDCLKITKLSESTARIEVRVVQGNQHLCNVAAVAKLSGNVLSFEAEPEEPLMSFDQVRLILEPSEVRITQKQRPEDLFCGVHASLNQVSFPLSLRDPKSKAVCVAW